MRLKLFSAPSQAEALALVKAEMGEDAIILTEREVDDRFEIRAAVERAASRAAPTPKFDNAPAPPLVLDRYRDRMRDILTWHGAPDGFSDVVANAGTNLAGTSRDPATGFSASLEGVVGFSPIPASLERPFMLVGPPGSGKTATTAKLIRRALAANADATALVADFDATGGRAQLAAYLQRHSDHIQTFLAPDTLSAAMAEISKTNPAIVIDTPPINPCDSEDMRRLADLISMIDAEPVLVLSAEGHPLDLEDSVKAFANVGIKRCILTKLDVVRRRAGALCALSSAGVNLSHFALTPFIGGGLIPATPNRLARLLLEDAPGAETLKGAA